MRNIRNAMDAVAVAVLVGLFAFAPRADSEPLAIAGQVQAPPTTLARSHAALQAAAGAPLVRESSNDAWLRVAAADGRITLFAVESDGSITLRQGATVSFDPATVLGTDAAGRLRGFVPVAIGDEIVLLPVFRVRGGAHARD